MVLSFSLVLFLCFFQFDSEHGLEGVDAIDQLHLGLAGSSPHLSLIAALLVELETELGLPHRLQALGEHLNELDR